MKTGSIFLGAYLLVILLIVLFTNTAGGHMSGLLLVFPALPWSLLGNVLFGYQGIAYGTWIGLAVNAVLAFGLGYWIARRRLTDRS